MKKIWLNIVALVSTIAILNSPAHAGATKKVDLSGTPPVGMVAASTSVAPAPSNKCDYLLDKCEFLRQKQKEVIVGQDDLIQFQEKKIKNMSPSIFESPWFWAIVGAGVGKVLFK